MVHSLLSVSGFWETEWHVIMKSFKLLYYMVRLWDYGNEQQSNNHLVTKFYGEFRQTALRPFCWPQLDAIIWIILLFWGKKGKLYHILVSLFTSGFFSKQSHRSQDKSQSFCLLQQNKKSSSIQLVVNIPLHWAQTWWRLRPKSGAAALNHRHKHKPSFYRISSSLSF